MTELPICGYPRCAAFSKMPVARTAVFGTSLRVTLATLVSHLLFNYFFSPRYLHGYLWNINMNVTAVITDSSVPALLEYQQVLLPPAANLLCCFLYVLVVLMFLKKNAEKHLSACALLTSSSAFGLFNGLMEAQVIFLYQGAVITVLHVAVYAFMSMFFVSLILTFRIRTRKTDQISNKYVDK
ncbi:unnamed protein product [Soboliphyme baturini]|uniref:DUF1404 domain-containing protein n=1 Tax=Soboliphyme baturini TaxID=241478 RepID=A0A183IVU8_9BILA|nr:unnamed protein product [Soboliphyme baturini]